MTARAVNDGHDVGRSWRCVTGLKASGNFSLNSRSPLLIGSIFPTKRVVRTKMSIAVISDLHLGPGDRSDVFRHTDEQFLRFLAFLEKNFERIVLLGDVWETLTPAWPGDPASALRKAREAHPEIARRFERPKYTYVHGNHDLVAGAVESVPEELIVTHGSTRMLFTHGHHHDVLIRKARWLSELGVWLGGWILRAGMRSLYRLFDAIDHARSGVAAEPEDCTFQRWAISLARTRNADVIVTGHTHVPLRTEHPSGLFLNSGSCADGKYSFLSVDPARGSYGVHAAW
jgi:predicted phosphodiesterase